MKIKGTAETIREIEKTIELAKTKGDLLIGKEAKKQHPIQGEEWESAAFSRTYEVFIDKEVKKWEDSSRAFVKLLVSIPAVVKFWYEYREGDERKGTANVNVASRSVEVLFENIPGFKCAFKRALNNNGGRENVSQERSSQSTNQGKAIQESQRRKGVEKVSTAKEQRP